MRIPPQKIDEIFAAMDIVDIVGEYAQLKRKGQNYWAKSPWKNERTPSFSVSPAKGIYKDFSTGKGGNAINFLMEMEGFSYPEALRHVAKRYNIELPEEREDTPEERAQRDTRESLFIVNEWAAKFFGTQLLETEAGKSIGLSYFRERGILESTIREFQLGYAPETWDTLVKAAAEKQFNEAFIEELGLASRSERTGSLNDRFRGRVMFPIHNAVGKVVGFGGRILSSEAQMAKYINSPESQIYHKSEVLYGLNQARTHIRTKDQCILTEGYMDVLRLHQSEIRHAVASSGTALTIEQIRLIKRLTRNVLLIFDGDAAGIKAAMRGIDLLLAEGMEVRVLILPDNHDPDSYVKQFGAAAFLEVAEKEQKNFLEFKINVLNREGNPNDPKQQAATIRAVAESLARMPDVIERQMYARVAAERLRIGEELLAVGISDAATELRKQGFSPSADAAAKARTPEQQVIPLQQAGRESPQERELLRILMNYYDRKLRSTSQELIQEHPEALPEPEDAPTLAAFFIEELQEIAFDNQIFEGLRSEMFAAYETGEGLNLNVYLNHTDAAVSGLVADLLAERHTLSANWKKIDAFFTHIDDDLQASADAAIRHYKYRKILSLLDEAMTKLRDIEFHEEEMAAAGVDVDAEVTSIMEIYQYLLGQRREIEASIGIEGATGVRLGN